jgi:hypothetical protein
MKFMCLVYHDEKKLNALSQEELNAKVGAAGDWMRQLEEAGHHVIAAGLQSARTATTLAKRDGTLSVTDGPFAETKEVLGGFILFDARDLNEAIQLASKFPSLHLGSLEVRPVLDAAADMPEALDRKMAVALRRHNFSWPLGK